ncbi:MAG: NAD(P)-binding domain-containing protein [Myxococcales bacterium]
MKTKIGIIGNGNVGSALERGLKQAGQEVKSAGNDPAAVRGVADWAEVIVLAVPFGALGEVVKTAGSALDGKVVVDVTNALNPDMSLALGFTTSGAEELQKKVPRARVVKAFNTVFAQNMGTGHVGTQPLTALVAGDDASAKGVVLELAKGIGFEPVDAGPLQNARLLEPLGYLNIQLGYVLGMGTGIGFRVVRG